MKRKIQLELLATSALAIVLTLLFALYVFYGLFREQVVNDLKEDAWAFKNAHIFDNVETIHPDIYALRTESLRITVVDANGAVLFDTDADSAAMENHLDRPEIMEAFIDGEASSSRVSETMSKTLFYYAIRLDNGTVMRVSRVADSIFAVSQNILPSAIGVCVILFAICIVLSRYFTQSLVKPIERMAENLSEPGVEVPYKELTPFMATIRQQHEDILKNAQMRQEFTANVSHELKTPLTAISGYAELIEHGMASKETASRFAGEIHKNAARLLSLINDIIQLSQLDGGRKQTEYVNLDLFALAEECVDMLAMNAQKQNVTMQVCGKKTMVMADKQLMEELVYNLCDNAIRYNNRGGSVTVTVDQENGHTYLLVKDTGIGISKENQERVFERFYRVDKSRSKATGGTGLGLAIVKHIVSQHGATLSLESEEGKGTEIRVDFADQALPSGSGLS
ncbi:MAG: two-component sensor histidine kinase [Lachnoclostridium sp.]|nr:two-component sensor histidine kinase [Lachnoclostridium sp.]